MSRMFDRSAVLRTCIGELHQELTAHSWTDCNAGGGVTMQQFATLTTNSLQDEQMPTDAAAVSSRTDARYSLHKKKHLKNVGPIRHCEPPLHCHSPGVATVARRHCRTPPAHRCPQQRRQRQRVTEGTAMAPWNGPNYRL